MLWLILVFCTGFIAGSVIYKTYVIKLLCAFSFVFLFYKFSFSFQFIIFVFLIFLLIHVSVMDYFYRVIPVIFPTLLITFGIFSSFVNSTLGGTYSLRFVNSFLGILMGGGVLFLVGILGWLIYKRETIGRGDVKLMAAVGAFIGWEKVLFAIFIAVILGSIVGLVFILLKKIEKRGYIPFGPFLSVASFIVLFIPKPSLILT
ncbi:MAG: hypothetical protein Nk1A_1410 [Endomicrobiia bacterium]|nr:MAG: hypothetical protein Nk1A_1410 [Endomicrobiia bacterium]